MEIERLEGIATALLVLESDSSGSSSDSGSSSGSNSESSSDSTDSEEKNEDIMVAILMDVR